MAKLPPTVVDATVTLTYSFTDNGGTTYATGAYFGYCTVADVRFESPMLDATSGYSTLQSSVAAPNGNSAIAQLIAYTALNDLHHMLNPYYQMPYSGTDQGILQTLRMLNAKLAAARVFDRLLRGVEPGPDPNVAMALRAEAELIVHDIMSGAIDWSDVTDIVVRARKPALHGGADATSTPATTASDGSQVPIFSMSNGGTRFSRRLM